MATPNIPLTYKGHPLRRKDNLIYYGSMADKYIIVLQVLDSGKAKTKLTELHSIWSKNLEMARAHNDVKQTVVEEIKLETLSEIISKLKEV